MDAAAPLSVIICTHNPRADYFGRCLAALQAQTLPTAEWELVVIDNLSDEPLAGRLDLDWQPGARLVREEKLGLTPARLRGIREAAGAVLVFVDDDNVLDPDYLATTLRIARERPFLGSWSGQCLPSFEQAPEAWTERYWGTLCIRRFETEVWSNLPRLPATMPAGAGLCARRAVARRYLELHDAGVRRFQLDRTGGSLISGGDNDLAACACDLGLGMGLMPDLKLQHLIPPQRLTADYIGRLVEGIEFSSVVLDASRGLAGPRRSSLGRALDFMRVARLRAPHNRILAAAYRGRERALRFLESSEMRGDAATEPG
jgi:glycosyltransferase involved in cell wall biosynthesis